MVYLNLLVETALFWIWVAFQKSGSSNVSAAATFDIQDVSSVNHGVSFTQFSGIHVYDRQIMELCHPTVMPHMDDLCKARPIMMDNPWPVG